MEACKKNTYLHPRQIDLLLIHAACFNLYDTQSQAFDEYIFNLLKVTIARPLKIKLMPSHVLSYQVNIVLQTVRRLMENYIT